MNDILFTEKEIDLIKDVTFNEILSTKIISNYFIEETLSKLRKKFCLLFLEDKVNHKFTSFLESLSCQCFLTEYIYNESDDETNIINFLIDKCKKNEYFQYLPIIACYKHLHHFVNDIPYIKKYSSETERSKYFFDLHIKEPSNEIEISKSIQKIGNLKNSVSKEVKKQYEIHPYPRWRDVHIDDKILPIEHMLHQTICNNCKITSKLNLPKVLIAGCGTGMHILFYCGYNVNKITAIDLSKKSLSFAKRKVNEYQIKNVEFFEMDILNLHLLKETFDVIECTGVLHHMANPNLGLKKLVQCLSPDGYLKLGLYSEKAREVIVQAHKEIKKYNFLPTPDGIKKFRKEVISGSLTHLQKITTTVDFYSLSTCRDLCFHVCEKRFTIKDIALLLKSNHLKFCGFDLPDTVKKHYQSYFPDDLDLTNLNNWEIFEQKNPDTFLCMYQFWTKHLN